MSDLTSTAATSSLASSSGLSAAAFANEPAAIRTGDTAAKNAYSTGVAFEQILFEQLTQAMTQTTDGSDGTGSSDASGSGSGDSSGADALSQSAYSSMIPQTLAQSVMSSGGGTALAMQIAKGIDPSLMGASALPSTAPAASTEGSSR